MIFPDAAHVVLAMSMVVLITAHIGVAIWLGFAPS